jgi:hypothetical protein
MPLQSIAELNLRVISVAHIRHCAKPLEARAVYVRLIAHEQRRPVPDMPDQSGPKCLEIYLPRMLYTRLGGVGVAVEHRSPLPFTILESSVSAPEAAFSSN